MYFFLNKTSENFILLKYLQNGIKRCLNLDKKQLKVHFHFGKKEIKI